LDDVFWLFSTISLNEQLLLYCGGAEVRFLIMNSNGGGRNQPNGIVSCCISAFLNRIRKGTNKSIQGIPTMDGE